MNLADAATKGEAIRIVSIGDAMSRMKAIRFGLSEGAVARCVTKVPGGPVVLKLGRQEIAIGRSLAEQIEVLSLGAGCCTVNTVACDVSVGS